MRKKFPANFTDLVILTFVAWLIKDFGILFNEFYSNNITVSTQELKFESLKALSSLTLLIIRIVYNKKENDNV